MNDQEDEEVSEFSVKIEDMAKNTTSRPKIDTKANVSAPPNPNARVTRSAARKYSG